MKPNDSTRGNMQLKKTAKRNLHALSTFRPTHTHTHTHTQLSRELWSFVRNGRNIEMEKEENDETLGSPNVG